MLFDAKHAAELAGLINPPKARMKRITVSREFTGGTLEGMTVTQTWTCDARYAGDPGDTFVCSHPAWGGSPYIDTTVEVTDV